MILRKPFSSLPLIWTILLGLSVIIGVAFLVNNFTANRAVALKSPYPACQSPLDTAVKTMYADPAFAINSTERQQMSLDRAVNRHRAEVFQDYNACVVQQLKAQSKLTTPSVYTSQDPTCWNLNDASNKTLHDDTTWQKAVALLSKLTETNSSARTSSVVANQLTRLINDRSGKIYEAYYTACAPNYQGRTALK